MKLITDRKVLLISPLPPPVGGIASWTVNLLDYLSHNKITNVEHLNKAVRFRRITSGGLNLRIISGIINFITVFSRLAFRLIKDSPDVIHITSSASFGLLADNILISLSSLSNVPVIMHWRFGRIPLLEEKHNWEWKLLCRVIRKSNTSIVIDNRSLDTLRKAGFTNVINIPNPSSLFAEHKANLFLKQPARRQIGRVVFVGHVIKNKGIFELVEACLDNPAITELLIIGPYEEETKKEIMEIAYKRNKGIWLKLIGQLNNEQVLEQMSKASIMALPSYSEGFPNVVIEAMAMGCAIIATEVGALPEMIDSKSSTPCGICVPVQDKESLKKAIISLTEDPSVAEIMGKRGIYKVLNHYTLEKVTKQYQHLWEQVCIDTW